MKVHSQNDGEDEGQLFALKLKKKVEEAYL